MSNEGEGGGEGRLSLLDVARVPRPGRSAFSRRSAKFTPDGARLAYLHSVEGSATRHLALLDVAALVAAAVAGGTADAALHTTPVCFPTLPASASERKEEESLEEQMRRERLRDLGEGLSSFGMSRLGGQLLVQQGATLLMSSGGGSTTLRPVFTCPDGVPVDVRPSNDGRWIAFTLNSEVHVVQPDRPATFRQVSSASDSATANSTRGVADFVAQEEFDRLEGYWWSPDSSMIVFQEVTEDHVPPFRIQHHGAETLQEEEHRYPFAGEANPAWRLGIVRLTGSQHPLWLPHPAGWVATGAALDPLRLNEYLVGVTWMPDSSGLLLHLLSRNQKELSIHAFDTLGRHCGAVHHETSNTWTNLSRTLWPMETMSVANIRANFGDDSTAPPGFILMSERSGFSHLYFHFSDGRVSHPITEGNFVVVGLEGVATDVSPPTVYFTATLPDDPTQQHLFTAPLFGDGKRGAGAATRLSREKGIHAVIVHTGRRYYVDIHSTTSSPDTVTVHRLPTGERLATLSAPPSPAEASRVAQLVTPEIESFDNRNGTRLYMALYRPDPSTHGPGPYPTILSVYGGPHVQLVQNNFLLTASMREQFYCAEGFLVAKVDNRGSSNRGKSFEEAIHLQLGEAEVQDQVDGLQWLVDRRLADPSKVVSMGWSYGGYMAARLLMHPESRGRLCGAVAGAPVSYWEGYDTGYTERYMGTPSSNPTGYAQSSLFKHVGEMQGSLLLVHGLIDENVHFRHTARLIQQLIAARKRYQLLLFPGERHTPRYEEDRLYMEEAVFEFVTATVQRQCAH